jgi:hypothetical protein
LESSVSKLYFDPVYSRLPPDPLIEGILAESRMLVDGAGVTGIEVESLYFWRRFDRRGGSS